MTVAAPAVERGRLLKVLGVWFGISAAIGNTIAAGIVRTPGNIAQWLPDPFFFIGVWLLGGLYAFCGASSMAELAVAIPRSGGQYNYSRRALGEYAGFIVGWSDWLSCCGTLAAVAIVAAEYSSGIIPGLAGFEKVSAVFMIVLFSLLQWRGIRWGSTLQVGTAVIKTVAMLVLVIACFVLGPHARATIPVEASPAVLPSGWSLISSFMLALQAVLYTIDGWNGVIYFGEEVKDPARNVPKAIFGSVLSIIAIYVLLNAAVLLVLPMSSISGNHFALGTASEKIFGAMGDPVIRSIIVVSLLSCINAVQLFCSRILYTMSIDGLFFRAFAQVNEGGTPLWALVLSTVIGIIFVLGSFERVIAMLSFFFVANYTLTYLSLFVLRIREPELSRPYRAWGYPYTSAIALLASALFLIGSLWTDRENAPIALVILALSYPTFVSFKRYANRSRS